MIIDFHNHLGVDLGDELSQTADQLLARMDEAAIDRAVVMPFPGAPDLVEANQAVLRAAAQHPDRFFPFLCLNPREHRGQNASDLERHLISLGTGGVLLHPAMHHFSLRKPLVDPLLESCARLQLPVVVHLVGYGLDDCSPIVELATRHPDIAIVVTPLHYAPGWAALAASQTNLYADTAKAMTPAHIVSLVEKLGADRVLFGSETPYMAPVLEREKFRYAALPAEIEAQLLGGNAQRLLKAESIPEALPLATDGRHSNQGSARR